MQVVSLVYPGRPLSDERSEIAFESAVRCNRRSGCIAVCAGFRRDVGLNRSAGRPPVVLFGLYIGIIGLMTALIVMYLVLLDSNLLGAGLDTPKPLWYATICVQDVRIMLFIVYIFLKKGE